jgi:hypothetical protein
MSYKPQTKKGEGLFGGPKGIAKLQLNKDGSKVKFTLDGKEYVISEFPEYIKEAGDYFVRLSNDADEILSAHPANGMFKVKVNRFPAPEGEEPAPKTREANWEGKAYSYQYFVVLLDVLDPAKYKGIQIPLTLRYHFDAITEEVGEKEVDVVGYAHPKSKYTNLLMDFCDATGVWNKGAMPYKANVLPMLAKRIANEDKTFSIVVKDGWPVTIFQLDVEDKYTPDTEEMPF